MDPLQLTLVVGLLLMALVNAGSLFWASFLDRKLRERPVPKTYEVHVEAEKLFDAMDLKSVEKAAAEAMKAAIHNAASELKETTDTTVARLGTRIDDMTNTNLTQEFEQYQVSLQALRDQTIQQFGKLQAELDSHRDKLMAELEGDIAKEQARRMDRFNERLNDVISNYLVESLGNQVDLGAQTTYIIKSLETHKEDIKRDMLA